jgi:hypothetical protein
MEKVKLPSWADFSEDETSDTEELTPSLHPNKKLLLDSIKASSLNIFHLKVENLPYSIVHNEEIYNFLNVSENEVTIRMQYKGKKFIGYALAITKLSDIAIRICMKYGTNFNGRSILIYYRPNENSD